MVSQSSIPIIWPLGEEALWETPQSGTKNIATEPNVISKKGWRKGKEVGLGTVVGNSQLQGTAGFTLPDKMGISSHLHWSLRGKPLA